MTIRVAVESRIARMARPLARAASLAAVLTLAACVAGTMPGMQAGPDPSAGLDLSARGGRAVSGGAGGAGATEIVYFDDAGNQQVVPQGVQALGTGYTINLQGVTVDVAAKSLLTDILGASYTIDPSATGTVTMATGGPVPRDKLLKIFEEALKVDGLVLIKQGDAFVIQASGNGMTASMANEGFGLTALPLHHLGAKRMLALLDGFAVPEGTIRAASSDDMLLVKGTAGDRAAVADIVSSLDSGVLAKPNAGIAFLKNASASAVASDLASLADSDPAASGWRVQVLDRSNALLVMARGQGDLQAAMAWIRRLDRGGGADGGDVHVYQVQYAKASDLAKLLTATFGGSSGGAASVPASNAAAADGNTPPGSAALDGGGGLDTLAAPAAGTATVADLGAGGGGDVRFTANDGDNTIIIRAPEPTRGQALSLLASLDKAPVQVLIDVMLVEVTLNGATSMGVQAYLQGANGAATVSNGNSGAISGNFPGFDLVLGNGISPKVIIDSLSKVTKVKVVSAPSVVAFENEEAEIKVVEQVPIVTQQVTSTTTTGAPTVNSVEYKDAGVILRVTPQVSQSNLVNLQVNQELSAVVGATDGTNTLTPTLQQRSITTRVAVYDKQTVVLGGLISQQTSNGRSTLFGLIPSHADGSNARTELVVFITPHVVRNQQDAASVSAELRAKMGMMANP
jgi:general secretion pathway protein D